MLFVRRAPFHLYLLGFIFDAIIGSFLLFNVMTIFYSLEVTFYVTFLLYTLMIGVHQSVRYFWKRKVFKWH